jgi:hypothetical protein
LAAAPTLSGRRAEVDALVNPKIIGVLLLVLPFGYVMPFTGSGKVNNFMVRDLGRSRSYE